MQRSLQGAGDPIPYFTRTETPDPAAVKLLNILVKFPVRDTWTDATTTSRFPSFTLVCCSINYPCSIVQFPVTNTLADKEVMSCSDAILYWLRLVFCVLAAMATC